MRNYNLQSFKSSLRHVDGKLESVFLEPDFNEECEPWEVVDAYGTLSREFIEDTRKRKEERKR